MFTTDINIVTAIIMSLLGYMMGSISFARVVVRWRAPRLDITRTDAPVSKTGTKIRMNGIGGTSVMLQLNKRWGFFTGFLDWLKVFAPALALRLIFPAEPYFLIYSTLAVIGHNWPVYYGFKGGYGQAAISGGIMVADWPFLMPALIIMFGTIAGVNRIFDRLHLSLIVGMLALLPWFWLSKHDWWYVIYCAVVISAYIIKVIPDMKAFNSARASARLEKPA